MEAAVFILHPKNHKPFFLSLCCPAILALKITLTDEGKIDEPKRGTTAIICFGLRLQNSTAIKSIFHTMQRGITEHISGKKNTSASLETYKEALIVI